MSTTVSLAGSLAAESALQGLQRSGDLLQTSAETVLSSSISAINQTSGAASSNRDTVAFSEFTSKLRGEGSLEGGLLNQQVGELTYTANARVVQGTDAMIGTLYDVIA